jgi:hypothetical protein
MRATSLIILLTFLCSVCVSQTTDILEGSSIKRIYSPAISLENPVGGGHLGEVAVGFSYQNKTMISDKDDASVAVYLGLGNPEKFIGGGLTVNIFGLTNNYGELNNVMEGGLDFHLNKFFLNKELLLDAGVYNPVVWGGNSYISYQMSWYLSGNYFLRLKQGNNWGGFSYLSFTGGLGNGNFRTDNTYTEFKSGSFEPFFSLALPVFKGCNIIAEWNGYDIAGGISIIPFQKIPLMLSCEYTDLNYGDPRMVASLSYPLNLRKGTKQDHNRPHNIKSIRPVRTISLFR